MAIYFIGLCVVTLVLLVRFISDKNHVSLFKCKELMEARVLRQPFGGIADILNTISHGTECKVVEDQCNFTALGLRVSETKCLDYVWNIIIQERIQRLDTSRCGGGRSAIYGELSHMGAVGWRSLGHTKDKWVYKCGASLISDKFLTTAAHCSRLPKFDSSVYNHEPEVVKLGDKFINNADGRNTESRIIRIDKFIKHPEYASPRHYYDIALIELQERVTFGPVIRPACLWNSRDTSAFGNVAVSGWGEISPFTGAISDELQVGDIGIIDDRYCDTLLNKKHSRRWRGVSDHQLCAGLLSGSVDTCRGDSGGPLQAKINISLRWPVYHLIGVTSFSYGCMRTNVPGVYVRVSSFVDWIESIVWPETN